MPAVFPSRYNTPTQVLSLPSHVWIVGATATFGRNPGNVAVRVLDVARLAVDAVLRIDDVFQVFAFAHPLVDAGRTISGRRAAVDVMLRRPLQIEIGHMEMCRLILFVICVRQEY